MFGKKKNSGTERPRVCAVLVAAGSSRRMGGENKLMMELGGIPVLAHTLMAFERCDVIDDIVLVCREEDIVPYSQLAQDFAVSKLRTAVRGGDSRTASVLAGVHACPEGTGIVAIHDGARPLVPVAVIAEAVETAVQHGAAAPVVAMKDSIKRIDNGFIAADVPREKIAAVQTPQVFQIELIDRALRTAERDGKTFTDDCAAVEDFGKSVRATTGSYENIKITTPEDLLVGEAFLQGREYE